MTRRFVYGSLAIIALGFLSVVGLRSAALDAGDASAGKKNADVVSQLENRIAALETRIAALEKFRAASGPPNVLNLQQPGPPVVLPPFDFPGGSPQKFNGNWCYTILIDGSGKSAMADGQKLQR